MLYFVVSLVGITLVWMGWNLSLDAAWQPTDRTTIHRILSLAMVKQGELVVDLGCGDGRIVVLAAREFAARAVGVEIDPVRALWGKIWIGLLGLSGRAQVNWGNMYKLDLRRADVIILFLSAKANRRLKHRLEGQLRQGARIVSYYHPMPDWTPDQIGSSRDGHPLYLYRIKRGNCAPAG